MKHERTSSNGFLGKVSYSKDRGKEEVVWALDVVQSVWIPGTICNYLVISRKPSPRSKSTCQSWWRGEKARTGISGDTGDLLWQPPLESTLPPSLLLRDVMNCICFSQLGLGFLLLSIRDGRGPGTRDPTISHTCPPIPLILKSHLHFSFCGTYYLQTLRLSIFKLIHWNSPLKCLYFNSLCSLKLVITTFTFHLL